MNTPVSIKEAYERIVKDPFSAFLVSPIKNGENIDFSVSQILNNRGSSSVNLVPGSFNPLHEGHRNIYDTAILGRGNNLITAYEISIRRIDKENLGFEDLCERIKQFSDHSKVVVTNAMYFFEKSGLFCNHPQKPVFHIGFDTAERIIKAHGILGTQGICANFFVYDRLLSGKLLSIKDWDKIPTNFIWNQLVKEPIEISSTLLREKRKIP